MDCLSLALRINTHRKLMDKGEESSTVEQQAEIFAVLSRAYNPDSDSVISFLRDVANMEPCETTETKFAKARAAKLLKQAGLENNG